MTEQERINVNVENRLISLETKFELFMQESRQQREDMRRLWERQDVMQAKHDAEMKALQEKQDAEMKAMQEKQDAKMHEMNQRFYEKIDANAKEFTQQLHTNFIQTMIGVGAIMAAIGGLIITTLK